MYKCGSELAFCKSSAILWKAEHGFQLAIHFTDSGGRREREKGHVKYTWLINTGWDSKGHASNSHPLFPTFALTTQATGVPDFTGNEFLLERCQ